MRRIAVAALAGLVLALGANAEEKGSVTELDGLKSQAPVNWKRQEPAGRDRVYQFDIPKAEGDQHDGQLLIFHFGPGGGGGVQANIERWKGMIKPSEGAKEADTYKTSEFKVGNVKVTMLEANGTYIFKRRPFDPNEKGEPRENYQFLGVIFESANGPYFIRMVGPKKTLEANRKNFEGWLKNFK